MSARVKVRRAAAADLPALTALEAEVFPAEAFGDRQLRYLVTRARGAVFVAAAAAQVIGSGIVLWRRGGRSARLHSLAVATTAQGTGVGARLLAACERAALAAGYSDLRLEVRAANVTAREFYRRHGFQVVANLPGYYGDGANGVRMSRPLGSGWQPHVAAAAGGAAGGVAAAG